MPSSSPQHPEIISSWRMSRLPFILVSLLCIPLFFFFTFITIVTFAFKETLFHGYSLALLIVIAVYSIVIACRLRDFGFSGLWALLPVSCVILLFVAPATGNVPFCWFAYMTCLIVVPSVIVLLMLIKGNSPFNIKQDTLEAVFVTTDNKSSL